MSGMRALIAFLVLAATASLAQPLTRAERPPVAVGDSTVFRDTDLRTGEARETKFVVTAVGADTIVCQTSGATSGARTFTREWNPVEVRTGELVTYRAAPFQPILSFPLEPGKSWRTSFEVDARNNQGVARHARWRWDARVADVEPVSVPAGVFEAFRVTYAAEFHTVQGTNSWDGTESGTVWYAPAANRIVKREFTQSVPARGSVDHYVIEMVSFTAAPPS